MIWLADKADTSNMTVSFKKRTRKNEETGYSIVMSKDFKEYVKEENFTGIRFGYDSVDGDSKIIIGLNKDGQGESLVGANGATRKWFDITNYVLQYLEKGIDLKFMQDYKIEIRKNGTLLLNLSK